jgi:hypothetical protein
MKLQRKKGDNEAHAWVKPLFEGLKPVTLRDISPLNSLPQKRFLEWVIKEGATFNTIGVPTTHQTSAGSQVGILCLSPNKRNRKMFVEEDEARTFNSGRSKSWDIDLNMEQQYSSMMLDFATEIPQSLLDTLPSDEAFCANQYRGVDFEAKRFPPSNGGETFGENISIFDNCTYNCGFRGKLLSEQGVDLKVFLGMQFAYIRNLNYAQRFYQGDDVNRALEAFNNITLWLPPEAI